MSLYATRPKQDRTVSPNKNHPKRYDAGKLVKVNFIDGVMCNFCALQSFVDQLEWGLKEQDEPAAKAGISEGIAARFWEQLAKLYAEKKSGARSGQLDA